MDAQTPSCWNRLSRWLLLAGKVRIGQSFALLGLALQAEETCSLPPLTLAPDQWYQALRLEG